MRALVLIIMSLIAGRCMGDTNGYARIFVVPDEQSFHVGVPFDVTVAATGLQSPGGIEVASSEHFSFFRVSLTTNSVEGSRSSQFVARYQLLAKASGDLELPIFEASDEALRVRSKPKTITVKQPEVSDEIHVQVRLSAERCYVGQPVSVTYRVDFDVPIERIRAVDLQAPLLRQPGVEVYAAGEKTSKAQEGTIGFPVNRERVVATRTKTGLVFSRTLVPRVAGRIDLSGAELFCSLSKNKKVSRNGFQYPSYFDNQFFKTRSEGEAFQRVYARAGDVSLDVVDVPLSGRPADYQGQVGLFRLVAALDREDLTVGEPVGLQLHAVGYSHPEALQLPGLYRQRGVISRFDYGPRTARGRLAGTDVVFDYTLRARSVRVDRVPAIRVSTFDPIEERYVVVTSNVRTVSVSEADIADGTDATLSDGRVLGGMDDDHAERSPGLRFDLVDRFGVVRSDSLVGIPWLWVFVLPPTVFVLLIWRSADYRLRKRDPIEWRARTAYRRFARGVESLGSLDSSDHDQLERLCAFARRYFSDHLNLPSGSVTFSDLASLFEQAQVPPGVQEDVRVLFLVEDRLRWSEEQHPELGSVGAGETVRRVERCVAKIGLWFLCCFGGYVWAATGGTDDLSAKDQVALRLYQEAELAESYDPDAAVTLFLQAAAVLKDAQVASGREGQHWFNRGTCYLRGGDHGEAVAAFRRAEYFLGSQPVLQSALSQVRQDVQSSSTYAAGPQHPFEDLRSGMMSVPLRFIAFAFCGGYLLVFVIMTLQLFRDGRVVRVMLGAAAVLTIAAGGFVLAVDRLHEREVVVLEAVVTGPTLAPGSGVRLVPGQELDLIERRVDRIRLRLPDGQAGWVDARAIAVLRDSTEAAEPDNS